VGTAEEITVLRKKASRGAFHFALGELLATERTNPLLTPLS
jgi:hypothetical protein